MVWDTVKQDLPFLHSLVTKMLANNTDWNTKSK
ncbi:hypothetical protein [Microcystis sp. 0824]|nr:hypothetical protein [Microcystis sp. 0824]